MTVSIWNRSAAPNKRSTGVAVIGAGIAGLGAAIALIERGVDCLVIDRTGPGGGASTRNAGFLMRGAASNYADAVAAYGRERAAALWRLSERNMEALLSLGLAGLASFERRASCLLALTPEERSRVLASRDLLHEDGFEVEVLEARGLAPWAPPDAIGLLNPADAVVNPRELVDLLAARVGDRLLAGAEATSLDIEAGRVVVRTPDVDVTCERVLVCLNAYTPLLLPELAGQIVPARGQMLALQADADQLPLPFAYYANFGSEYFRRVDAQTVILGGWRKHSAEEETTFAEHVSERVQVGLQHFADGLFGRAFPVTARWAGIMGFTRDGLPITGPLAGRWGGRVWVCGGFTGHGMSLGFRTAQLTALALLGEGEPPLPRASLNPRIDGDAGPLECLSGRRGRRTPGVSSTGRGDAGRL